MKKTENNYLSWKATHTIILEVRRGLSDLEGADGQEGVICSGGKKGQAAQREARQ